MANVRAILENVFGMLGIFFWSFQLLPQVRDNYKTKNVEGLSAIMFFIWTMAALGFGSYGLVEELSIPLIVQPQIFGVLSTLCYLQCLYYTKKSWRWSLQTTLIGGAGMFLAMAAIEAGAYFATQAGLDRHVKGTIEAAGILPIALLGLGFVPQYVDIYRDRSVGSVSMPFIAADAAGAVFSMISLGFREEFDLLATMNYVVVLICDLIVVAFWVYYNKMHPELSRIQHKGAEEEEQKQASVQESITPEDANAAAVDEKGESKESVHTESSTIIEVGVVGEEQHHDSTAKTSVADIEAQK